MEDKKIPLSHLEKELYPGYGFTKAQVIEYYRRIFPFIGPHLRDRALTLKRYPDGVKGEYFFEKRCPPYRPPWVKTADVSYGEETLNVCLVNDLETLMWVENLASLELHVPLSRAESIQTPDAMVFDLDPGDGADILDCARVALTLRDMLASIDLSCFVKTSGMKGLHVLVPLNKKESTYEETKTFSKTIAEVLQREYPDSITAKISKEQRKKKVFINWSQNEASKTMICVYSLRAREKPAVSFPLGWTELERALNSGRKIPDILYSEAIERLENKGDLFAGMMTTRQGLPYLQHEPKRI